jgi:tRNA (cytidine/uridine-2'-O-)-methyltransferase
MFNIVLFQPEIPPNTGNIIRLCANTGCRLHLVKPLGFALEDKKLRRAGLDYHEWADVEVHDSLEAALLQTTEQAYALSTRGQSLYHRAAFSPGDTLIFGPETRGLPSVFLDTLDSKHTLRLPMLASSRSLNLSNTVAVVVYEALRQQGFSGLG